MQLANCKQIKPFGLELPGTELPLAEPLKELLARHGLLIFRDCATRDRDQLIELCRSWGPIFSWPFGEVLELVTHHEPKNYIFTPGSVPLHWDGAFREQVPGVEVFHCLEAPDPGAGGETTFVDTPGVLAKAGSETGNGGERSASATARRKWFTTEAEPRVP